MATEKDIILKKKKFRCAADKLQKFEMTGVGEKGVEELWEILKPT